MVLADHVYTDRDTGKKIIAGVFSKLTCHRHIKPNEDADEEAKKRAVTQSVGAAGNPWLYAAFNSARGELELELRWVHLETERRIWGGKIAFRSDDPLVIHEIVAGLPSLNSGLSGWHALELLHNNAPLGSLRIYVEQKEHTAEKKEEQNDE